MTAPSFAGLRQSTRNRETHTIVSVYDGIAAGMDTDGGRWSVVCEDHGEVMAIDTLRAARSLAADVAEWCERCQDSRP